MKKSIKISIFVSLIAISGNIFSQALSFAPFQVDISGHGKNSIIFIPGFACSGAVWNDTKALYEKNYTCYTLTMAGFAGVPAQADPTFQNWEKGIADYIRQNKIDKPIVVGHSMGGGLAMALAADYPDLISKIVVVDALPCLAATSNPSFKSKDSLDCSPMVEKMAALTDATFKQMQEMMIPRLLADTSKLQLVVSWSLKSDRTTFAEMFCSFYNTDLRGKMAAIKCPALILLETETSDAAKAQFESLKTANIQYATKGLHFIMYDDKEWYDKQLKGFIN